MRRYFMRTAPEGTESSGDLACAQSTEPAAAPLPLAWNPQVEAFWASEDGEEHEHHGPECACETCLQDHPERDLGYWASEDEGSLTAAIHRPPLPPRPEPLMTWLFLAQCVLALLGGAAIMAGLVRVFRWIVGAPA